MELIDKDAVVAEIKRRIKINKECMLGLRNINYYQGKVDALNDILSFLGTIKVKDFWKPADGEDLPDIDKDVIVLTQPYPLDGSEYVVHFAHRPNPDGWDGKSVTTGKVEHYTPKIYDKGGWSIPNVVWWLDCDFPKKEKI